MQANLSTYMDRRVEEGREGTRTSQEYKGKDGRTDSGSAAIDTVINLTFLQLCLLTCIKKDALAGFMNM